MRQGWMSSLAAVLALASCAGQGPALPEPAGEPWQLETHAAELRAASCPEGTAFEAPVPLTMSASPVTLGEAVDPARHLPGARFVGGWHLTSEDPNLGGLSGLEVLSSDTLLAITDEGAFIWIGLDASGAPASAKIAYMRGGDGGLIALKEDKDAEGLAFADGLALVSFERNHRILAFDLEGCGAAARGALVAELGNRISGMTRDMESNGGVEGLSIHPAFGTLSLGIETPSDGMPRALLMENGVAEVSFWRQDDERARNTGLDRLANGLFMLRRDYQPGYGNDILVEFFNGDTLMINPLVRLDPSVTVDNFEGIAVQEMDDGTVRLWLVSDNNFSERQRTLLMAFDLN